MESAWRTTGVVARESGSVQKVVNFCFWPGPRLGGLIQDVKEQLRNAVLDIIISG